MASIVAFEGLVEPAVVLHPLAVRSADPLSVPLLTRVVQMGPSPDVLEELLAAASGPVVAAVAGVVPVPALVSRLPALAAAGSAPGAQAARWTLLRVGEPAARQGAMVALAHEVGVRTRPNEVETWLAAATASPHLLSGLAEVVPEWMRPCVARFAGVAAAGGSPARVFASELISWAGGEPRCADWTRVAVGPGGRTPAWADLVRCTGLEGVAQAALAAGEGGRVWEQVLAHPHLAGGPAYARARTLVEAAIGCGPLPDAVVLDRAPLVAAHVAYPVGAWLAAGREGGDQVAHAWARLRELQIRGEGKAAGLLRSASVLVACELACADGVDGPVWRQALAWAQDGAAQAPLSPSQVDTWRVLTQVADAVHGGGSLGDVHVVDLYGVYRGRQPSWVARLVGQFLAGVPRVDDPVFVQALLTFGDQFEGTFDDLVAVAVALAA